MRRESEFVKDIKDYPYGLLDRIFINEKISYTKEVEENLELVIKQLPEIEQEMILLRYRDKKLIEEIGEKMNRSQGNVSSRIQWIMMKLNHPIVKKQIAGSEIKNGKYAIENFPFDTRTYNGLRRNGIESLDQIESIKQLKGMRSLGKRSINIIMQVARENGLSFRRK